MVSFPPTSQPEGSLASTLSSTLITRSVSFWYRSIAPGSFSLAKNRNHPACPKYGLNRWCGIWGVSAISMEMRERGGTHPWPEDWKKSHWSSVKRSASVLALIACAASYFAARYRMIASDSLAVC